MTLPALQLSPHFTLGELVKSQLALRRGIANNPPRDAVRCLATLCRQVLEPVREHFGRPVVVSSGYRSPRLNAAVAGHPRSQHILGQAVDFEVLGVPNVEVWDWIRTSLDYDQVILEYHVEGQPHSGWVHVSFVDGKNRKDALRIGAR
jgi:zinc D-Ala-D-Ala carboxypeptidase